MKEIEVLEEKLRAISHGLTRILDKADQNKQSAVSPSAALAGQPMNNANTLTEEDKNMISYFWTEKGDLERWSGWDEAETRLEQSRPEILKAWNDYKMAIRTLNMMVESLHG